MIAKTTIASIALAIYFSITCCTVKAQETPNIQDEFDSAYAEWRKYIETVAIPKIGASSSFSASILYDNDSFDKIVALDVQALPYITAKLSKDRPLIEATHRITKWQYNIIRSDNTSGNYKWSVEDFPEISSTQGPPDRIKVWNFWWNEGRFQTGERFEKLNAEWKKLKAEGKDEEAEKTYQKIVNLGIPVLPYLVDKVDEEPEFMPAITQLNDGATSATLTPTGCKQWWTKSKAKFELPPKEKPDVSKDKQ